MLLELLTTLIYLFLIILRCGLVYIDLAVLIDYGLVSAKLVRLWRLSCVIIHLFLINILRFL